MQFTNRVNSEETLLLINGAEIIGGASGNTTKKEQDPNKVELYKSGYPYPTERSELQRNTDYYFLIVGKHVHLKFIVNNHNFIFP